MKTLKNQWFDHIYAAWLGKIIGVRVGAQVENWHHDQIHHAYGFLSTYPHGFHPYFAADDDLNGPYYFTKILDRFPKGDFTPQQFGDYLVECICDHRGFFWWGGVDISSEERGYTNLIHGIPSPLSGSVSTNGTMLANQIGGQIFIDGWGYVCMGDIDRAMELAGKAACAMHDQNGIEGAKFVAGCIAGAFNAPSIEDLIHDVRSRLDDQYDYGQAIDTVIDLYHQYPNDPQSTLDYLLNHHGYHHYEGACHIIPNTMLMIYALLYGQGDFSQTIRLCNNAGYDTDCNVGNVGSIMGAYVGLKGIDPFWIDPLKDMLIASGSNGYTNAISIAQSALWFYHAHCVLYDKKDEYDPLRDPHKLLFDLPYQTHGITTDFARYKATSFTNGDGLGHWVLMDVNPNVRVHLFYPSLILPNDLYDARYNPQFTSRIYPGETITFKLGHLPQGIDKIGAYWQDVNGDNHYDPLVSSKPDLTIVLTIPDHARLVHGVGLYCRPSQRQLGQTIDIQSITISGCIHVDHKFSLNDRLDYGLDFGLEPHIGILDMIIQKGDVAFEKDHIHLKENTSLSSGDPNSQFIHLQCEFAYLDHLDLTIALQEEHHGFDHRIELTDHTIKIQTPHGLTTIEHEFTQSFKNSMVIRRLDDKMEMVLNGHIIALDHFIPTGRYELTVGSSPIDIYSIGIDASIQS